MTQTEALKLALEALEIEQAALAYEHGKVEHIENAITAIKEALAQPEQEPVAWLSKSGKGIWFHKPDKSLDATPLYAAPLRCPNCDSLERQNAELDLRLAEQDQMPFGFLTNKRQRFNFEPNATGLSNMPMTIDWKIPLYGAPQPQRKPLTDKQLNIIGSRWHLNLLGADEKAELFAFARAIEAAHGIKE